MNAAKVDADFLTVFREHVDAAGGMSFARFMELSLYHPRVGYYRRDRARVGYGGTTDFFTATASGPIFGELVLAACKSLLGNSDPAEMTFVEVGAESAAGVLTGVVHPFRSARVVRVGEPIVLRGPCVVFSNELFDAQPFRRLTFRNGQWRELGVALIGAELAETLMPLNAVPIAALPASAPEGYAIDAPVAAVSLAESLATQPWTGLFIAIDYGKSWPELAHHCPEGTGRAYYRHAQSNDLLARPGEQDLTCHVCWDWLTDALAVRGFRELTVESQEAFLVKHAAGYISQTLEAEAARYSQKKLALLQLLHPAHLGQKFQVLHGVR